MASPTSCGVLVTDQAAACAVTTGELLGEAQALALAFDLDEVAGVDADRHLAIVRQHVRSLTVELRGASWGAVGLAVTGELRREPGTHGAPVETKDADDLVARLTPP